MSKRERWLFASALFCGLLPFVVVASSLQILPNTLEIRIDISVTVDVVKISKYNYLYLGIFSFIPLILAVAARLLKRKGVVGRNFTSMVVAALVIGMAFSLVGVYGVVYQIFVKKIDILRDFDFVGAAAVVLSLLLGFLCNVLPDIKPNDFLGIKNRYTRHSAKVWKKVHTELGEIYMIAYFFLSVVLSAISMWLDYKYSFIQLIIFCGVSVGLVAIGTLHSKLVYNKIIKANKSAEVITESL